MPTNVKAATPVRKTTKLAPRQSTLPSPGQDTGAPALDSIDHALIEELQDNARISFAELARRVQLSKPAVMERVRRLEATGVILRYRTEVDPAKLGLTVRAFVKITVAGDRLSNFARLARSVPEVVECHRVTGNESFLVQVVVRDMNHLETVIDALMPYLATNTSMVLNSPVQSARIPLPAPQPKRNARR